MSTLYTEIIQDAYRNPRHRGQVEHPTHCYEDENPLCGDRIRIEMRVEDGQIIEARFQGQGCAISQAATELLLELVEGQPASTLDEITKDAVLEELGLPSISPARLKCALLPLVVMQIAISG